MSLDIVEIIAIIAIVVMVGIFGLVAMAIYLREVISFKGKAKVDTAKGTVDAEVAISETSDKTKKEPSGQ